MSNIKIYGCVGVINGVDVDTIEVTIIDQTLVAQGLDDDNNKEYVVIDLAHGNTSCYFAQEYPEQAVVSVWDEDPENLQSILASEELMVQLPTNEIAEKVFGKIRSRITIPNI